MNWQQIISNKCFTSLESIAETVKKWNASDKKIVFTNGCFDLLHLGHIDYLSKAASLGDKMIIGLNSDSSVAHLKGDSRPIFDYQSRAMKLASLAFVDAVVCFEDETPIALIKGIKPFILVKGGDYTIDTIVGASEVLESGGEVKTIPFLEGYSSTQVIEKIKKT